MRILLAIFCSVILLFTSCGRKQLEPESREVLGTICTINLYESGTDKLYQKIFERLEEIDKIFNLFDEESEISIVNNSNLATPVSDEFIYVLQTAINIAQITEGNFNPAIGSITELWRKAKVPTENELQKAILLADYNRIKIDIENKTVYLEKKGMKLDLNGIVKGFAADSIFFILSQNKVHSATINLGGNLYVYGTKKDKSPWKIGIKNPTMPEGIPAVSITGLSNTSINTSGIYDKFFITNNDNRNSRNRYFYHHIIDPKTGYPTDNGMLSMTVICKKAIYADALGTALFVMGKDNAFKRLETITYDPTFRMENTPLAISITEDGKITASQELEGYINTILDDYVIDFK